MEDIDHITASDNELIAWCQRWKDTLVSSGTGQDRLISSSSNILVRINDKALIKFGPCVTASEAANQIFAFNLFMTLKADIRVPKVHRFLQHESANRTIGYLVMDQIHGQLVADLCEEQRFLCVGRISHAIELMWQVSQESPGPVDKGEPRGKLWAPDCRAHERFMQKTDIETWFNRALRRTKGQLKLRRLPLVFCHFDIAPRNVILQDDSTLCIMDWAYAGFFPKIFEVWVYQSVIGPDMPFFKCLLSHLPQISQEEEEVLWTLWQAYRHNMLYGLQD